jgi:hypothetical protein
MMPARIGKRFAIFFVGGMACLVLLLSALLLSGQFSPRGFVSGTVYAGFAPAPAIHQPVIFDEVGGQASYATLTDGQGRFSIALPPGDFHIASSSDCSAGVRYCRFAAGPRSVTIAVGEHLDIVLQTCGDKCPG